MFMLSGNILLYALTGRMLAFDPMLALTLSVSLSDQ